MPKATDLYPSNSRFYKAAEDFKTNWKGETWEVNSATAEDFSGDTKLVLWFNDHDKGIVLNKTNTWSLVAKWDDDYEKWRGGKVQVETIPRNKPDGTPTRGFVLTPLDDEPDDEIPF